MLVTNQPTPHMQPPSRPLRRQRGWDGPCRGQGGCSQTWPPGAFWLCSVFGIWPRTEESPFLSPVNSAEQTVSRERGSPWENVLARPGALVPHVGSSDQPIRPGPHPEQPFFLKSTSCWVIKGSTGPEQLMSYSTVPFACVVTFN